MSQFNTPVSALIICKDEVDMIADCLQSVDFCAEIVVVDSGSTDGTLECIADYVAKGYPIRLFHNDWPGFARQRLFALQQATQPWCLCIEADERADAELRQSIIEIAKSGGTDIDGWFVRRRDYLKGYGYAHRWVAHNRIFRIFRRDKATMDVAQRVHESFRVPGRTAVIERGMLLHRRATSLTEDLKRTNSYSSLKVEAQIEQGDKPSMSRLMFSPWINFLKFYVGKRYFLCGRHGYVHSAMVFLYSYVTEAKLFEARDASRADRSAVKAGE